MENVIFCYIFFPKNLLLSVFFCNFAPEFKIYTIMIEVYVSFLEPDGGSIRVKSRVTFEYLKMCISSGTFNGRPFSAITVLNN